jgi:hypothetical protein
MRMRAHYLLVLICFFVGPIVAVGADGLQTALAGLQSEDSATYEKAVAFLTKHPKEAEMPLRAMFQDSSKSALARLRAVKFLGDVNDSEAADDLRKELFAGAGGNAAVRREIIRSLSKIGRNGTILDYLKSGKEESPVVMAAIALTFQDDKSKDALGHLLASSDDPRVFRAATFAIYKTYKPTLDNFGSTWSGSFFGPAGHSSGGTQPPPPELAVTASGEPVRAKLEPTSGDRAIFSALKAKKADKDPEISKTASDLLAQLSEAYKQPD